MADAGAGNESSMRPTENASGWTFNWSGLVAVLLIAAIGFVAWRWFDGPSVGSDAANPSRPAGQSDTSAPTDSVTDTTRATTPSATTTLPPEPATVASTTAVVAPDRQVLISGEMKPCRFGANCLVASFKIVGFEPHPGRFVCMYPNSQRDFSFNREEVDEACLTADQGDTITIEVDGVRSATISEQNLDGT